MTWCKQPGIRWRLALLYLSLFGVGLIVFCAVLFQYFQRTQSDAFDATLYNFAVDISTNLEMDFVGRLFVVNSNIAESGKLFPFHLGKSFFEIRDSRGKVLLHSRSLKSKRLPLDYRTIQQLARERAVFQTISPDRLGLPLNMPDHRLLSFWAHHADWREPLILQIAVPLDLPQKERKGLLLFFALAIPSFLLITGAAGLWMSRRALRPVHDMILKAKGITGVEKLRERIPVPKGQDEIRELAETFNGLLDRLEKAFESQDRFISNASHQLKTPLTILKGELDLLLRSKAQGEDLTAGLESAADEIKRLIRLVQDLLLLARLEAGEDSITLGSVRLDEVLMRVVSRLQKLGEPKGVKLKTQLSSVDPGSELDVEIQGDEELLGSMLENFIENAIKYAPENSPVEVGLQVGREAIQLNVRDEGPGVPPDQVKKVFERFTRGQATSVVPGSGLGLSIAGEIARLHNVKIDLSSQRIAKGTQVTLTFPRPQTFNQTWH